MESLRLVAEGSPDVAVGVSGFGSARIGAERWQSLAALTGRTTYYLSYDAQELPWTTDEPPPVHKVYWEVLDRWNRARKGAKAASSYLASWLTRWAKSGRKILLVGFSLGAYTSWLAVQKVPDHLKPMIELVMISAAIGDTTSTWKGIDRLGFVLNLYSSSDAALMHVYPRGVGEDETPAAGLGPLVVGPLPNLRNVDVTDIVGWDHLKASRELPRLASIGLGCLWGSRSAPSILCDVVDINDDSPLSDEEISRLIRWCVVDSTTWLILSKAMLGDPVSIARMRQLDEWSLKKSRLFSLMDMGVTVQVLCESQYAQGSAERGRDVLSGFIRRWISGS